MLLKTNTRWTRRSRVSILFFSLALGVLFSSRIFLGEMAPAIQSKPEHVVSLNLCTDELLLRLSSPENIAAITRYSANPNDITVYELAKPLKKIRGLAEEVLMLDPDLILAGSFTHRETVYFLKRKQIPVLLLDVARSFEDVENNIQKIAAALNEEKKSQEIIGAMKEKLSKISSSAAIKDRRWTAVFYENGGNVPGSETIHHAVLEAAGLRNLAAEMGIRGYGKIPLEKLVLSKPDVLIFSTTDRKRESVGRELLLHPVIQKKMQHTKILTVPSNLLHCGTPAAVEAAEMIVNKLNEP